MGRDEGFVGRTKQWHGPLLVCYRSIRMVVGLGLREYPLGWLRN